MKTPTVSQSAVQSQNLNELLQQECSAALAGMYATVLVCGAAITFAILTILTIVAMWIKYPWGMTMSAGITASLIGIICIIHVHQKKKRWKRRR